MTQADFENRVALGYVADVLGHHVARPGLPCFGCGGRGWVIVEVSVAVGNGRARLLRRPSCPPCNGTGRWPA